MNTVMIYVTLWLKGIWRENKKSQMLGDKAEMNEADVLTADGAYVAPF